MVGHYLDEPGGLDEVDCIVVVFLHPGPNGENVGIKDDVIGIKSHFVDEQRVGATADLDLAVGFCGL